MKPVTIPLLDDEEESEHHYNNDHGAKYKVGIFPEQQQKEGYQKKTSQGDSRWQKQGDVKQKILKDATAVFWRH